MFRAILRRYGIAPITIGITVTSILLSLGITWSVNVLMNGGPLKGGLVIAILVPLLIVPLMTLHLLRLLSHLDTTEQQLRVLSYTDELTQLYNRRYFMQYVSQEFKRAQRSGEWFAIAILDLDNFKQINDQWGHLAGDQVLQALSRQFEGTMRQADICARYGGDEFIFLFPNTNRQQVQIWADRLYKTLAENPMLLDGGEILPRFSVGVAVFEPGVATIGDLFKQADDSLYQAKHKGGNQYEITRIKE